MCVQNKRRYLCHCVKFEFFDQCAELWGSNRRCGNMEVVTAETDMQYCRNHTVYTGEPMYRRRAGQARGGRGGCSSEKRKGGRSSERRKGGRSSERREGRETS